MSELSRTVDVARIIDVESLRPFNYRLILISWLITLFDGFDQMMISFTAPYMRDEFGLTAPQIGWIVSSGLAGMMAGGFLFSWLADRIGRRPTIVAAAYAFGVLTLATAFAGSFSQLVVLRFVDGLAIGGMLPLAWALNIEFVPRRIRATVVTVIMLGYSLGTAAAGPLTSWLAPAHGWQAVYAAGGAGTLVCATLLLLFLPESPRFLVLRGMRPDRVAATLNRLDPALGLTGTERFVLSDEGAAPGKFRIAQLFAGDLARITPLLWLGFMASSLATYFLSSWSPIVLEELSFPRRTAALVASSGSLLGALGGLALMRFTDRYGAVAVALYPAVAIPVLIVAGLGWVPHASFLAAQILVQLLISGGHFGITSITGIFYPSSIRASGAGWAASLSKLGGVLGPVLGGYVMASGLPVVRTYALLAVCPLILVIAALAIGAVVRGRAPAQAAARRVHAA